MEEETTKVKTVLKLMSVVVLIAMLHSLLGVQVFWHTCCDHCHTDKDVFAIVDGIPLHIEQTPNEVATHCCERNGHNGCHNHHRCLVIRINSQTAVNTEKKTSNEEVKSLTCLFYFPFIQSSVIIGSDETQNAKRIPNPVIDRYKHNIQHLLCVMTC